MRHGYTQVALRLDDSESRVQGPSRSKVPEAAGTQTLRWKTLQLWLIQEMMLGRHVR